MSTVYLLHLNSPMPRGTSRNGKALFAGHYIGYTDDLIGRILDHLDGRGARFTQVCVQRGIRWTLARTWEGKGATRSFERRLKKRHEAPRFCPICNPTAMNLAKLEEA